ncbi:hypothetical protein K443DRAFT_677776 [Laccaria amethystina LaAM-08-1]|uniref:Unplaced genomic scaffold K443scaffold_60, whole genome shotgun sequence n=1 Tax=Laccaria amethystina LaAM-08-1 TaxID=1095629 RepID=A0A0C9WTC6_9AGAR|nr:hypothetical protein K443DRAFT_677776 [Laccaria amethystina LaAM-08-1]
MSTSPSDIPSVILVLHELSAVTLLSRTIYWAIKVLFSELKGPFEFFIQPNP